MLHVGQHLQYMGINMNNFGFGNGPRHAEEMPLYSEAAFFSEILFKLTHDLLLKWLACKVGQVSGYLRETLPHIKLAVTLDMAFLMVLYCTFNSFTQMWLMVNILIKLWRSQCTSNNLHVVLWSVSINKHINDYFNTGH